MGLINSHHKVVTKIEEIKSEVDKFRFYDWNEIMSFVPDSDELKEEIENRIEKIDYLLKELEDEL